MKLKKINILLITILFLVVPNIVKAEEFTKGSSPNYLESKNIFVANGTSIIIKEKNGTTYVTYNTADGDREVAINSSTLIIGGYYNPCNDTSCTIDLNQTSIIMESGNVGYIIGGNVIDKDYTSYKKIHISTIDINIKGGTIKEVSAVTGANSYVNTALSAEYYSKIAEYYYADKVNINISKATVSNRVYILSSYTYAKDVVVNITNNSTIKKGYYALAVGTNGYVDNYTVNINNSNVDAIHSGFRTMVNNMTVNASGSTVIGDIYAGSYYGIGERYEDTNGWNNWSIGDIDYGQVKNITFNLIEDTTYNNIYAGFQFVDKDKFLTKFQGNSALTTYAKGFDNAENSKVIINIANLPNVTDSKLKSMIDTNKSNVTINYTPNINTTISNNVATGTILNATDSNKINKVMQDTLKNHSAFIESSVKGIELEVAIEQSEVTDQTIKNKINKVMQTKNKDSKIIDYLNIEVLLKEKSTGQKITTISELTENIDLTFKLPAELEKTQAGYTRTYFVIREHNGNIELIDTKLERDNKTITFSTNKFSSYAIGYVDIKNSTTISSISNPKTLDSITTYIFIIVVSLVAITYTSKKIKIKINKN